MPTCTHPFACIAISALLAAPILAIGPGFPAALSVGVEGDADRVVSEAPSVTPAAIRNGSIAFALDHPPGGATRLITLSPDRLQPAPDDAWSSSGDEQTVPALPASHPGG